MSYFYLSVYPLVATFLFISPLFNILDCDTWSMVVIALSSRCCSVAWIIGLWSQLVRCRFWSSRLPRSLVPQREFPFKNNWLHWRGHGECLCPLRRLHTQQYSCFGVVPRFVVRSHVSSSPNVLTQCTTKTRINILIDLIGVSKVYRFKRYK